MQLDQPVCRRTLLGRRRCPVHALKTTDSYYEERPATSHRKKSAPRLPVYFPAAYSNSLLYLLVSCKWMVGTVCAKGICRTPKPKQSGPQREANSNSNVCINKTCFSSQNHLLVLLFFPAIRLFLRSSRVLAKRLVNVVLNGSADDQAMHLLTRWGAAENKVS